MENQQSEADKRSFTEWVTNPWEIDFKDSTVIESMVQQFPYCQVLQALEAKSLQNQNPEAFAKKLSKASLYAPDRTVLFNLINHPEKLISVNIESEYEVIENGDYSADLISHENVTEPQLLEVEADEVNSYTEPEEIGFDEANEEEVLDIDEGEQTLISEEGKEVEPSFDQTENDPNEEEVSDIEEGEQTLIREEDKEVELSFDQIESELNEEVSEFEESEQTLIIVEDQEVATSFDQKETETKIEEEKMILENISATDFFAFEEKLDLMQGDSVKGPDTFEEELVEEKHDDNIVTNLRHSEESNEIARYDDEQMPYSFLWWLHKTRKEHADNYQPYVDFKLDTSREIKKKTTKELNQQIIENIFHLQSPLDEMEDKPAPQTIRFEVKRKEDDIIEKFIREEPQIHAPSPDKLDLENKARKSAEDPNDLVSETLASIYTEQMLFHKAIDTYKKLSLKFPEKRAYFADQISELEKKIN